MRKVVVAATVVTALISPLALSQRAAHATTVPTLSVADVTSTEGDSGTALIRVPVDLSEASPTKVKVPYSLQIVADGGWTDASDAAMKSGTLTFAAGVTSKYVTVTTTGDTTVEPDQHFLVRLGTPIGNATIAKGSGLVTITDDDANGIFAGTEVSVGDVVITEGDQGVNTAFLPVTLSRPATVATKVRFVMSCATAQLVKDVTVAFSGNLNFPINTRTAYIQFKIDANTTLDALTALKEVIKSSTASVLQDSGTVTIVDDDGSLPSSTGFAVPGFATETLPSPSGFNAGSPGDIEPITVGYDGSPAAFQPFNPSDTGGEDRPSDQASMSADGRFVAFSSVATNLVPGDTNGIADVFVRDRLLGTTTRIVKNDGTQIEASDLVVPAFGASFRGLQISADGNTVVFRSSGQFVPADTVGTNPSWLTADSVYSWDRTTHMLALESVDSTGTSLVSTTRPTVSANGRYVAFGITPDENNVLTGGYSSEGPVLGWWVRDRVAGTTTKVMPDDNISYDLEPAISANGRYLVAPTTRGNCVDSELDAIDLKTGSTERIDVDDNGEGGIGSSGLDGFAPSVSADGRYVAFQSQQWNLVPGATHAPANGQVIPEHAYLRDRTDASTLAIQSASPTMRPLTSDSGQYVAYADGINWVDPSVLDTTTMTTTPIGTTTTPVDDWYHSTTPMTGDGRYVAFSSTTQAAPNHLYTNIFVRRMH